MLLPRKTDHTVVTEGLSEVTDFKIAVNGKAFRILLDGLYINKIKALIRELCTNAFDAQVAAGKKSEPFTVKLPSHFDPTFSVRDYGVSMTHEQVTNLYSTLFESSKDSSNSQVGMLGLGSKSPFAYVDAFTVTAWLRGEKRVYSAFIGGDGIPKITLLSKEESAEPDGIEVSLIAQIKDCAAFRDNATEVLRWFPVRPIIQGAEIAFPSEHIFMDGKGWRLLRQHHGTALARQGCVVYPLDAKAIPNLSEQHRSLLLSPLLIDFPIGTLDVTASREALSYEPLTCDNITARLNSIVKEITDSYADDVESASTLWDAGKVLHKIRESALPACVLKVIEQIRWNGRSVSSPIFPATVAGKIAKDCSEDSVDIHYIDSWRAGRLARLYFDHTSRRAAERSQVYPGSNVSFFVRISGNEPTSEGLRVKQAISKSGGGGAILIVVPDETAAAKAISEFGDPPFTYTHDLPKPVIVRNSSNSRRTTGKTKKTQIKARRLDTANGTLADEAVYELDGDAYYIPSSGNRIVRTDGRLGLYIWDRGISHALRQAQDLKYFSLDKPVYFVNKVYIQRVKEHDKWQNILEIIDGKIASTSADLVSEYLTEENRNVTCSSLWTRAIAEPSIANWMHGRQSGALAAYTQALQAVKAMGSSATSVQDKFRSLTPFSDSVAQISRKAREEAKNHPLIMAVSTAESELHRAYPLANNFQYWRIRDDAQKFIDYIEAMDLLHMHRQSVAAAA